MHCYGSVGVYILVGGVASRLGEVIRWLCGVGLEEGGSEEVGEVGNSRGIKRDEAGTSSARLGGNEPQSTMEQSDIWGFTVTTSSTEGDHSHNSYSQARGSGIISLHLTRNLYVVGGIIAGDVGWMIDLQQGTDNSPQMFSHTGNASSNFSRFSIVYMKAR